MQTILSMLAQLKRPGLLVRAAHIMADRYRRDDHLSGYLGTSTLPRHGAAVMKLMEVEAELDRLRREGAATYSHARHVEILGAMIGESRLLEAALA